MPQGRNYYKRKMYFDREDRILLHLLEFTGYESQRERPDDLTQFGIADATGLGRSTISKSIRLLTNRGLVHAERAHVPSGKLRRTTYLLTEEGQRRSRARKDEIEREVISVKAENGSVTKMQLKEIPRQLPAHASTASIAVHVNKGVFDVDSFIKGRDNKRTLVDFTERAPRPRYFLGRRRELGEVDAFLSSRRSKFLALTGIPGIGKTTLLVRRLEDWRKSTNLFWYRVQEWSTLRNILRRAAQFLECAGRKELSNYMAVGNGLDLEDVTQLLEKDLRNLDAVLILDDCHKASDDFKQFLQSLRIAIDGNTGPKVIVAGRWIPQFYDRRDAKVNGLVKEMEIRGLDKESSGRLLSFRNVDFEPFALDGIYQATKGHPLFLELIDPAHGTKTKDIVRFLEEDLVARLSQSELSILEQASVFRYPVSRQGLLMANDADMGNLEFLIDRNLVRETALDQYEAHDLLKDFFKGRMTAARRRRCDQRAARYHLSIGTSEDLLEAGHHMLEAGDREAAANLLAVKGRDIAREGHSVELEALLRRVDVAKTPLGTRLELMLLSGQVLSNLGEWEDSLTIHGSAAQLAKERNEPMRRAAALKAMGDIYLRRNDWRNAMDSLNSSLSIYKDMKDARGSSAVHFAIGTLNESFGYVDTALKHFRRASRLVNPKTDPDGVVQYLLAYSRVLQTMGEAEKSLRMHKEALKAAESVGDLHVIAKATVALGVGLMNSRKFEEGLEKCREGISLARRIGDSRILGYGLMNAASALLRKKNAAVAEANLEEAMRIFEKLGEKVPLALCMIDMAYVSEVKGKWEDAKSHLSSGLKTLRGDHSPLDLLNSCIAAAELYEKHGELGEAKQLLASSRSIAKRLGRDDIRRYLETQMSRIKREVGAGIPGAPAPA